MCSSDPEAASQLRDAFPLVHFRIAGEGEQRDDLTRRIHDRGLGNRFLLTGAEKDVPRFLASLDVAVLPSRAEGMSNAVLEYMAAGRPIVATAVGATPDVLREGRDGLLVPPDDAGALAEAIGTLLRDRSLACSLGASARERVITRYSRAAMVRRFEDFYVDLVTPRVASRTCVDSLTS